MKIRTDFVTNSSSSSFIIVKEDLTPEQIRKLLNWERVINMEEFRAQTELEESEYYTEGMWTDSNARIIYLRDSEGNGTIFQEIFKFLGIENSKIFRTD